MKIFPIGITQVELDSKLDDVTNITIDKTDLIITRG